MSQTTIDDETMETGRALGYDLIRYTRRPPLRGLPPSVIEGMHAASQCVFQTGYADRFVTKWLQLRLGALRRGRFVDPNVTSSFLRRIDVPHCPVTRMPLTHGELGGMDWSIDRLNNGGGYSVGNLAVMSARANTAKGARSFDDVLALSRARGPCEGLSPVEWARLASMMVGPCFVSRPGGAPVVPLCAPPPPCSIQLAIQVVQFVFSRARTRSIANQLEKSFRRVSGSASAQFDLGRFVEAIHLGLKRSPVVWDVWLQDAVLLAFREWWAALDVHARARAAEVARSLSNSTRVGRERMAAWRLDRHGYSR